MSDSPNSNRPWYQRIGPGLITACVVIGPGSILTSSKVGANEGYSKLWIVLASVAFMLVFMTLGAKLGAVAKTSPGNLIRKKAGPRFGILVGCCVFFISAAFQSGNNLGVAAAIDVFTESKTLVPCLVIAFNLMAITFLFAFKNLYRILERLMMFLVAMMLISFAINLIVLRPNLADLLMGFIPFAQSTDSATTKTEGLDGLISLLGLIGTTFVITAAFYQSYLVRQKGWDEKQVESGIVDARVGAVIMTLITVMLVSTAAAGLYDGSYIELANPIQVADELEPTFGTLGKYIFSLGLFSAAFSSFLVNSMIGGFIVSDCLGYSSDPHDRAPKIMTTVALLTGMVVALAALILDLDIAPTIIAAQAVTVVGAPLIAGVLLWLASSKDIMGSHAARPATITFATVGLVVLIAIAANTAINTVPTKIRNYINKNTEQQSKDTTDPAPATPAKD
ncbi:MAG: Nramp family divalent metal transporter [Rubripirellula sp.]|jgi:NRAMP (natural resistance-associated macrophage protein)-like metal ion transporter